VGRGGHRTRESGMLPGSTALPVQCYNLVEFQAESLGNLLTGAGI